MERWSPNLDSLREQADNTRPMSFFKKPFQFATLLEQLKLVQRRA
jgi:hypothetical protein